MAIMRVSLPMARQVSVCVCDVCDVCDVCVQALASRTL